MDCSNTTAHFISVCVEQGTRARNAVKVPLNEAVAFFGQMAQTQKEDNTLMFNGFLEGADKPYPRNEQGAFKFNVMFVDCDNPQSDKDIINKFKKDLEGCSFILYETFSSTPTRPKFRAIIPMSGTLKFTRYAKKAIKDIFKDYADEAASWFFAPDTNHLNTMEIHEGKLFDSAIVQRKADSLMTIDLLEQSRFATQCAFDEIWGRKPRDVSQNDKVRHYMDTPYTKISGNGDSDLSLYRAICVCLAAGDEATLEQVRMKALGEKWSAHAIERKIKEARKFVGK